jgi:hypothetical protein
MKLCGLLIALKLCSRHELRLISFRDFRALLEGTWLRAFVLRLNRQIHALRSPSFVLDKRYNQCHSLLPTSLTQLKSGTTRRDKHTLAMLNAMLVPLL